MIRSLPAATVSCPSCLTEFPVDPAKVPSEGIHAICSSCQRVFRVEAGGLEVADTAREVEPATIEGPEAAAPEEATPATDTEEPDLGAAPQPYAPVEPEPSEPSGPAGDTSGADVAELPTDADEVAAPEEPAPDEEADEPPQSPEPGPVVAEPTAEEDEPSADRPFEDLRSLASEAMAEPADEGEPGDFHVEESTLSRGHERFGHRDPHERARRLARVLVSDIIAYYPVRYHESFAQGTLKEDFEEEVKKSWKEYVDQVGEELAESTPYFDEALNDILGKGESIF